MESQREYEHRSLAEADRHLREIERAPLAERKEAAANFLDAIRTDPALVAERLGWIIDGNYGYGEMMKAKQVVSNPRLNREAILVQMVAAYEWMTPGDMARAAWKKLTGKEKQALSAAVDVVITAAEAEMKEEG